MHADDRAARASPRAPATIVGAALLLTLAGCAVGPTFATPETPVLDKWRGASDPRITTQNAADSLWWKAFKDPALDRLVDLAHRQNLPLQMAGLRIVEARAQFGVATGLQFPQTQAGVRQRRGGRAHRAGRPLHPTPPQPARPIRWASTPPGSWTSGASTAGASRRKAPTCSRRWPTTTRRSSRSPRRSRGRTSRFAPRGADRAGAGQRQDSGGGAGDRRGAVPGRRDVGAGSDAGDDAAGEHPGVHSAASRSSSQQARNALSTLLGQPAGAVEALLAGPKEIPKPPAKVAVGVPAEMLRRRPDIRSAELRPPRSAPASASPRRSSIRAFRCSARSGCGR